MGFITSVFLILVIIWLYKRTVRKKEGNRRDEIVQGGILNAERQDITKAASKTVEAKGLSTNEINKHHSNYTGAKSSRRNKRSSLEEWEDSLVILWAGSPKVIEFTYESWRSDKKRRKVSVEEIAKNEDGEIIFNGICLDANEQRSFKRSNITTMLKIGSKRMEVEEWLEEEIGIDWGELGLM